MMTAMCAATRLAKPTVSRTLAEAGLRGFHHPALSGLFWLLQALALAQPHTGAAAILIDEFDAGVLQCAPDCEIIRRCHRRFVLG